MPGPVSRLLKSFGGGVAAAIGLAVFLVAFPSYILDPLNVDWIYPFPHQGILPYDFHTHYLGWLFLRHTPGSFPLGAIPGYVAPLSTYIAYTDSLPLMAFALRPFTDWLPGDFQYFGIWVLLCCVLQAVFAWRLLGRWIRDPLCLFAGVLMIAFSPILIWRWMHVALMSHWLLLWCLDLNAELYFKRQADPRTSAPVWRPIFLVVMSTLIQPYLAAMVAGLCWALPLSSFLRVGRSATVPRRFGLLAIGSSLLILPMGLTLYCFGFLGNGSYAPGFHYFGTDLLSLFNNHGTSSLIPAFKVKAGLAEGYAWPGLGGLILIICSMNRGFRQRIRAAFSDPSAKAVLIACGLMWFFALSERIHVGTFWLIDMEWFWMHMRFLTSSLRTAGRFIWPVYYAMFLSAIVIVSNWFPRQKARVILIAAVLLQAVDLGPWMAAKGGRFGISPRAVLIDPFWTQGALRYRHIKMIPPVQDSGYCDRKPDDFLYDWVEFAQLAAKHHMTINSGYLARYDRLEAQAYCGAETYEFIAGPLHKDSLYILRRGYTDKMPTSGADRKCREIDGNMVCVSPD